MSIDYKKDKDQVKKGEREETYEEFVEREKKELLELIDKITGGKVLIKFAGSGEFEEAKSSFSEYAIDDEEAKEQAELTDEEYGRVMDAITKMQQRIRQKAAKSGKK